jgi:hypothetical protein
MAATSPAQKKNNQETAKEKYYHHPQESPDFDNHPDSVLEKRGVADYSHPKPNNQ